MLTIKKKVHLLSSLMIVITAVGMLSMHFYDYWKLTVQNEFIKTKSMSLLLDKQLEGTYNDLIDGSLELDREEQINKLNRKLQPIIDKMSEAFPVYGTGFYSRQLNSIVAYGPDYNKLELKDLYPEHKERIVLKTKKNYQFKDYSQTRDVQVVASIHPIIRGGEVIGLVWANIPLVNVFKLFMKQMKNRFILCALMLIIAYFGTRYITSQYDRSLIIFRSRVRNLDISEKEKQEILPEFMTVYQEIINIRKLVVDNERKYQREMTEKIVRAEEQERKRISRELHDGVGQWLYSILITLKLIKEDKKKGRFLEEEIQTIEQLTKTSMEEIKRIALDLRPSSLDDLGLVSSIKSLIDRYENTFQIKVIFEAKNKVEKLDPDLKTTLYRICQEALTNIAKYAETDKVFITIGIQQGEVILEIIDKGKGFDRREGIPDICGGLGLHGMEERTKLHGGTLQVTSIIGEGTSISVKVPIKQ